jgi:hypothetical protein
MLVCRRLADAMLATTVSIMQSPYVRFTRDLSGSALGRQPRDTDAQRGSAAAITSLVRHTTLLPVSSALLRR